MRELGAIRERYLRDDVPIRLGGLAANLSRIASFAASDAGCDAVASLIDESKLFVEWTAAETEIDMAAELVQLQIQLADWQRSWEQTWADLYRRRQVADEAGAWSRRVLAMSGLSP